MESGQRMNDVFETMFRDKQAITASGRIIPFDDTVTRRHEAIILYDLAAGFGQPVRTIETGMAFGLSTLAFCQAHQEKGSGEHVALDPYQTKVWDNAGRHAIALAGMTEYLTFLEERSFAALPRLYAEGQKFDVAFIDGNHRFEHAFLDFFYIDRMLNEGGFVMFHDTFMHSVRKVLSYIVRFRFDHYEMHHPLMGGGLPVWKQGASFLTHLAQQPYEVCAARSLAAFDCPYFMVFRKKAHLSDDAFDEQWEYHTAF